jgi:hypothetical protein
MLLPSPFFFAVFDDPDPAYKFGEGIDAIDERMPVSAYMKYFVREIDGKARLLVSTACLLPIFDVVADIHVVPIREKADFGRSWPPRASRAHDWVPDKKLLPH